MKQTIDLSELKLDSLAQYINIENIKAAEINGESLIIHYAQDGGSKKITLENPSEFLNENDLAQLLNDQTVGETIDIERSETSEIAETSFDPSEAYKTKFDLDNITGITQDGENYIIEFMNGETRIFNGFEEELTNILPDQNFMVSQKTFISDQAFGMQASLESLEEELLDETTLIEEVDTKEISEIEPEAGTETAAGARNGYGYQSQVENISLNSPDQIGAIKATQLHYNLSGASDDHSILNEPIPVAPVAEYIPVVSSTRGQADESGLPGSHSSTTQKISLDLGNHETTSYEWNGTYPGGLTSKNEVINYSLNDTNDVITAMAGEREIFSISLNQDEPDSLEFTYTLKDTIDHINESGTTNVLALGFGLNIHTDNDNVITHTIVVDVLDDTITAQNDTNTVTDHTVAVTGKVEENDDLGADGQNGNFIVTPQTTTSALGTLTLNEDGSYSYQANGSGLGTDTFTYTIQDSDGDQSTAEIVITVNDMDMAPVIGEGTNLDADEASVGSAQAITSTLITVDFQGEGAGDAVWVDGNFPTGLTSNSTDLTYTLSDDGHTLTATAEGAEIFVATLDIINDTTVEYKVDLKGPIDHLGDNENTFSANFDINITDGNDTPTITTVTLNIADDTITALDDTNTVNDHTTAVTGTVQSNDDLGIDGTNNGFIVTPQTTTSDLGTLTLNEDGSYSYQANGSGLGTDTFTYTIQDSDGDQSTAEIVISVDDMDETPTIGEGTTVNVDENAIGTPGATQGSTFPINFQGDGIGDLVWVNSDFPTILSSGETPLNYVVSADGHTLTGRAGDTDIFIATLDILNETTAQYNVTLLAPLDHTDGNTLVPNFSVSLTDADGTERIARVDLSILNDIPVASDESSTVNDHSLPMTGDLNDNVDKGADLIDATFTADEITGTLGTITINADGTYSYISNGDELGIDRFTYTYTDGDGDETSAEIAISVSDLDGDVIFAQVDETGVTAGTDASSDNQTVRVDFSGSSVSAAVWNTNYPDGLKSGNVDLNYVSSQNGQVLTGKVGTTDVIRLTLNIEDDTTISYDVEILSGIDHPDINNANDVLKFGFGADITSEAGETISPTLYVDIFDDAPIAQDDVVQNVARHQDNATGNLTNNDDQGQDEDISNTAIAKNESRLHGIFDLNEDGSFSYDATGLSIGFDNYTYQLKDSEGDTDEGNVQFITSSLDIFTIRAIVDETDLPLGIPTDTQEVTVDFDGPAVVSAVWNDGYPSFTQRVSGNLITFTPNDDGTVITAMDGNTELFRLSLNVIDSTTVSYTVELLHTIEHTSIFSPDDGRGLSIPVDLVSENGDVLTAEFYVIIKDDGHIAVDDEYIVDDFSTIFTEGNVADNDTHSQDGFDMTTRFSTSNNGLHGKYNQHGDGTFAYDPTGITIGTDKFILRVLDGDGDGSDSTVNFVVTDLNEELIFASVNESDIASVGQSSDTQDVNVVFSDNYAPLSEFGRNQTIGQVSSAVWNDNSPTGLTSAGDAIIFTKNGDGTVLTGAANGSDVIRLTLNIVDDTTVSYDVDLFAEIDQNDIDNVLDLGFGVDLESSLGESLSTEFHIDVVSSPVAVANLSSLTSAFQEASAMSTLIDDNEEDNGTNTDTGFGSASESVFSQDNPDALDAEDVIDLHVITGDNNMAQHSINEFLKDSATSFEPVVMVENENQPTENALQHSAEIVSHADTESMHTINIDQIL
ncbi:tandem-95 repeat protein [Alphaproteobacteria bacterium]|nr:tandem-95 repeat protein [Alphaproteobacteria bacterium]